MKRAAERILAEGLAHRCPRGVWATSATREATQQTIQHNFRSCVLYVKHQVYIETNVEIWSTCTLFLKLGQLLFFTVKIKNFCVLPAVNINLNSKSIWSVQLRLQQLHRDQDSTFVVFAQAKHSHTNWCNFVENLIHYLNCVCKLPWDRSNQWKRKAA